MIKNSIVRDLVKVLECSPLSYSEMQNYIYYHPSRKDVRTSSMGRGYWCTSLNKLLKNRVIYKNSEGKYESNPGESDSVSFF